MYKLHLLHLLLLHLLLLHLLLLLFLGFLALARHVLGGGIVRADHEERQTGFFPQRGAEMGAVHRGKPGNERRKPSALQQTGEGGGFLVIKKDLVQDFHTGRNYTTR